MTPSLFLNAFTVDDDIWLNVERLHVFLKELDQESQEYKTNYISGYVNQYYLDVARPGSPSNKVLKISKSRERQNFGNCFRIRFQSGCIKKIDFLLMFWVLSTSFHQIPSHAW